MRKGYHSKTGISAPHPIDKELIYLYSCIKRVIQELKHSLHMQEGNHAGNSRFK